MSGGGDRGDGVPQNMEKAMYFSELAASQSPVKAANEQGFSLVLDDVTAKPQEIADVENLALRS